jgi:ribosomal protein S18 acetylase RimI-like enzyme
MTSANEPANVHVPVLRQLGAADAEAFAALRREVTADNPVPMGLTLEEELTRPLQGFRDQLSYPEPNAAFGAFIGAELVGAAAVAWPSKFPSSRHKVTLWGTFVSPRFRRLGLARSLVARAVAHAQANGVRRVNLTVFVPNEPAVRLYQAAGFVACGVEPEAIRIAGTYYDGQFMSLLLDAA